MVVDRILRHGLSQEDIDHDVNQYSSHGESLYRVDVERLEAIRPDLIVTQELCDVCAVSSSHLAKALYRLSTKPTVLSLTPHTLNDVFTDIERVGLATQREVQAQDLVASLRQRVERIKCRAKTQAPRVASLEWLSPPFNGGHWIPEMVALAGGIDPLGKLGEDSYRMPWQQILDADAEVVLVMPCGYDLERAISEYRRTEMPPGWGNVSAVRNGRVYALNATAYFSRPGRAWWMVWKSCTRCYRKILISRCLRRVGRNFKPRLSGLHYASIYAAGEGLFRRGLDPAPLVEYKLNIWCREAR